MCDRASHWGCQRWMPNPTSHGHDDQTAADQVITLSEVGARSRRRALATARLLFLMSLAGDDREGPGGRPGCHPVAVGSRAAGSPRIRAPTLGHLAGLGECPQVVGPGGHRGDHVGHRPGRVGRGASFAEGDADQASIIRSGQCVAVQSEEGGVAPQRGEGQGLVGEARSDCPFSRASSRVIGRLSRSCTAKQVQATLLPGIPEQPSDLLGGGDRLSSSSSRRRVVPPRGRITCCLLTFPWPKRTCSLMFFGTTGGKLNLGSRAVTSGRPRRSTGGECCGAQLVLSHRGDEDGRHAPEPG